jgi:hypothetical protein
MKLPVVFFFQPAEVFTVQTTIPAQEMIRPQPSVWEDGQNHAPCTTHKKRHWRAKLRREVLQMEAA